MDDQRPSTSINSGDRYRLLIDSIADYAIYMLDAGGHVASWNPGAQRFKGYTTEEILGQHFSRFYTEQDRATGLPARALRTAATEGRFENEGWRVRKDGSRFWAHVIIDPIYDDGQLVGYAKVTRDLTERREAQLALAQTKEQLLQSQKMEAIGRLTGGVAHDFNNLLMAITGSLELLRKRVPDDPRLTRLIDNAMQGAQRGTSLTQRMLAFARRQELKPDLIDTRALVEGMHDLLTRSLGPAIEFRTAIDDHLSAILIDSNQLELALLNLAVNAKDAMPDGGILTIAAREEAVAPGHATLKPGRYIRLSMTDTGTGMDAETLAHATEPFFTTKGVGKGTGLGLAMVRGLTEQSGGGVTIESNLGHGTTVSIFLPVSSATAQETAPEVAAAEAEPLERRLKILVVDDDFLVAMNTSAMLDDLGHEVVEVHSGVEAIEAIEQHNDFDLMITDQAMPYMTGTQLINSAKAIRPNLPVILATGYAELPPDADKSLPRLNKPFFQSELEKSLAQVATRD